eukprot:UN05273
MDSGNTEKSTGSQVAGPLERVSTLEEIDSDQKGTTKPDELLVGDIKSDESGLHPLAHYSFRSSRPANVIEQQPRMVDIES